MEESVTPLQVLVWMPAERQRKIIEEALAEIEIPLTAFYIGKNEEFISETERKKFDCIISEYQLPEISGLEVLSFMKSKNIQIPFLMVTAGGDDVIATMAFKGGAMDYTNFKMFNTEFLNSNLKKILLNKVIERKNAKG